MKKLIILLLLISCSNSNSIWKCHTIHENGEIIMPLAFESELSCDLYRMEVFPFNSKCVEYKK